MITNILKKYSVKFAVGCGCATAALGLSSCSDFLDILPMNDVVLENYWTQKSDVDAVRSSCYVALQSSDAMERIGIWSELRSDNLFAGANVPNEVNEILKENILSTNSYCNWSEIYKCTNRCNIVCHYAPQVQRDDPNYSEAEMRSDVAEMSALRALCYFYLIRAFRDVPYSTEPSIDDTQNYIKAATPFNAVLDSLITNLESVKDQCVRRYQLERVSGSSYTLPDENTSRITRVAIWAILSDLYLWKGDWDNAIKYADMVINYKKEQYEELLARVGDIKDIDYIDSIPMILEMPEGSNTCGHSYNEIFGDGNSFESIFELKFSHTDNNWVGNYYGSDNTPNGRLKGNELTFTSMENVITNKNSLFKSTDGRFYESFRASGSAMYIGKYVRNEVSYKTKNITNEASLDLQGRVRSSNNANWIFYRLSDMLLIKAEALVERGLDGDFDEAFKLVNIVNKRANNLTQTLKSTDYTTSKNEMANLVMNERRREFMFEGKRWFDLVRRSRRDGNTTYLVSCVKSKYESKDANAIAIKMADPNIIYFPYAKNELKVNPLLQQNPAFTNGEDSQFER